MSVIVWGAKEKIFYPFFCLPYKDNCLREFSPMTPPILYRKGWSSTRLKC